MYNADSQYSCIISGIPGHCIEDVSFSNINIYFKGGFTEEDGKRIVPENETVYPEPWMFGTIPASGFYVRHARKILFENIKFHFAEKDGRPLFIFDDVEKSDISNIRVNGIKVENPFTAQ